MLPKVLTRTSPQNVSNSCTYGTTKYSFPVGDKKNPNPLLLSCILLNKSAIPAHEGINTLIQAMLPPTLCPFPLTSFPFPSFLSSLYFSLSSPTFLPDLLRGWMWGSHSITLQLGRPAPSGQHLLTWMSDKQGRERLASHPEQLSPIGSPFMEISE